MPALPLRITLTVPAPSRKPDSSTNLRFPFGNRSNSVSSPFTAERHVAMRVVRDDVDLHRVRPHRAPHRESTR